MLGLSIEALEIGIMLESTTAASKCHQHCTFALLLPLPLQCRLTWHARCLPLPGSTKYETVGQNV